MKHKYYIEYNGSQTEVFPINSCYKIKGNKEGWRFRENIADKIELTNGNGYEYIKNLENLNPELLFIIKRQVESNWAERVRGYFYPTDCEFDTDNCIVRISCQPFDIYNKILNTGDTKVNLLARSTLGHSVNANILDTDFEYRLDTVTYTYPINKLLIFGGINVLPEFIFSQEYNYGTSWHWEFLNNGQEAVHNPNSPIEKGWQIRKVTITPIAPFDPSCYANGKNVVPIQVNAVILYYRQVTLTFNINGVPVPPNSSNWLEVDHINQVYGSTLTKWGRYPYLDGTVYNFTQRTSAWLYPNLIVESPEPLNINFIYGDYWRSLTKIMQQILVSNGTGLTFESQLILSNNNPLINAPNDYYGRYNTITTDTRREIYFASISDVRAVPQATERAWKQFITFNEIMGLLKILFNGDWYISDNKLIFESVEYYRNGLKYPIESTLQNTNNLSALKENKYKNKYKYNKSVLCHFENIALANSDSLDFIGVDIVYNAKFNSDKQVVKHQDAGNFTTDLANVYINSNNMPSDGFVLAVIESVYTSGQGSIHNIINAQGKITGTTLTNGLLSISYLENSFYKYYRPFKNGILNLIQQQFLSTIPIKEQTEIIGYNCRNDFSPYTRIETELGVGEINEYNEDTDTGQLTMIVSHE